MIVGITDGLDHYLGNPNSALAGGLGSYWSLNGDFSGCTWVAGLSNAGRALKMGPAGGNIFLQRPIPSTKQLSMTFALRWDFIQVTQGSYEFLVILDSAGNRQFGVQLSPLGILQVTGEGGAIVASGTRVHAQNVSYRYALRADVVNPASTALIISINNTDDITVMNADIIDSPTGLTMDLVRFIQLNNAGASPSQFTLDDVIEASNVYQNLGELECRTTAASADIAVQWTPSTGAVNYANVDDIPFTADTDYNSSSTPGQKDLFDYPNLPYTTDLFFGVTLLTLARKEESGTRTLHTIVKAGGVEYAQPDVNLSQTYDHYTTFLAMNPNTGLAWTKADWDAMQAGYALVA